MRIWIKYIFIFSMIIQTSFAFAMDFPTTEKIEKTWQTILSQTPAAAQPVDLSLIIEFNMRAAKIWETMLKCASQESLVFDYLNTKVQCDQDSKSELRELTKNIHEFLESTEVNSPERVKLQIFLEKASSFELEHGQNSNNDSFAIVHPLFVQLILENLSSRDVFAAKKKSNNVGICTGFISIGYCGGSQLVPPELSNSDKNTVLLLQYLPIATCHWGLWPSSSQALIRKFLIAQGIEPRAGYASIFVSKGNGSFFASGKAAENLLSSPGLFNESSRVALQAYRDSSANCSSLEQAEFAGDPVKFFRSLRQNSK